MYSLVVRAVEGILFFRIILMLKYIEIAYLIPVRKKWDGYENGKINFLL